MINKTMFNQAIEDFELVKSCSFKADKDSTESKTVNLKIQFKGATINTLAQSCLSQGAVVKWQNGRARKDYDKIVDRSNVIINWARPATAPQIDPKEAVAVELAACETKEEQQAYINELLKRAKK